MQAAGEREAAVAPFWSRPADELLGEQGSEAGQGLSAAEAAGRLKRYGPNQLKPPEKHSDLKLLLRQLASPIALLLLAAAILSAIVGERTDAWIIAAILLGSAGLGFWQERAAAVAIAKLYSQIGLKVSVLRGGQVQRVPSEQLVPGDVLQLNAGDLIAADCRLLSSNLLNVEEAALTGESFPQLKDPAPVAAAAPLSERSSALFSGTHVVSGSGSALVIETGSRTQYGALADKLQRRKPPSEFEHGIQRFGFLLLQVTAVLVLVIFSVNIALHRKLLDTFMFSLALAVGLTPQLLPAIVSITLARGAHNMARGQVLVRRLVAIEDFGGLSVLCTDKTGTLTEGVVQVRQALDPQGQESAEVLRLAWLNATLQGGFDNPIDLAVASALPADKADAAATRLDEVPYDFKRRRLSVLLQEQGGEPLLVTKGALDEVLAICGSAMDADGREQPLEQMRAAVKKQAEQAAAEGLRVIAVATRAMPGAQHAGLADEKDMTLRGLLTLADPPKPSARQTLAHLGSLGIQMKMITGDNRLVAATVARDVGLSCRRVATGSELDALKDAGLRALVEEADVFAEIDPNQKERIILALKKPGRTVGFLGDGINDAAALRAADVGISVDTAVDVTREAADVVLLRKDLDVLADGVAEGRRAFGNTLKYIFITTSASFGNMFSMAGASFFTAFLPMLPKQILLLNLLSDLPAMAIATDRLDPEALARPRRWDTRYIRDFMFSFGLVSSAFDYLTFGSLLLLRVPPAQFRTAWFLESVLTEIFVLLVIRTSRVFFRSPPSRAVLLASLLLALIALALPWLPGSAVLGFSPLPLPLLGLVLAITAGLVLVSELAKRLFYRLHPLQG